MSLPVRKPMAGRRRRRGVRRPRLVNLPRLAGATLLLAAAGAFSWLIGADEFALDPAEVSLGGLQHSEVAVVSEALEPLLDGRPNLFRLSAADVERTLTALPAVADSEARLVLPDALRIAVIERLPILVWRTPGTAFLVDAEGVLLRELADTELPPAELPLVDDRRRQAEELAEGGELEPVDREAALILAAIDPAVLSSAADRLSLLVDDEEGYVMSAQPGLWRAVFGHYTPTLRRPEIIDRQVQCLRSLLGEQGEAEVEVVYLAPSDDRCGTFVARASPEPEEHE